MNIFICPGIVKRKNIKLTIAVQALIGWLSVLGCLALGIGSVVKDIYTGEYSDGLYFR